MKHFAFKAIVLFFVICIIGGGVKFYQHEKYQQKRIEALEAEYSLIQEKLYAETVNWNKNAFNYLAIGNSITLHEYADYWWNEIGMAASAKEKDYVHLVENYLLERYENVVMYPYNFYIWEIQSTDRAESLTLLDNYLSCDLDLITIQLGENAKDLSSWESDFEYLIEYIKTAAPKAQIVVIGDFWGFENRDEQKAYAAGKCGVEYISLEEIKDNKKYQVGKGIIVYGDDGKDHVVIHDGVSRHPGDKGMSYIAEAIKNVIE